MGDAVYVKIPSVSVMNTDRAVEGPVLVKTIVTCTSPPVVLKTVVGVMLVPMDRFA